MQNPTPKPLILFDGVCHFCNHAVGFTLKNDPKGNINFAHLQSETGKRIVKDHNVTEDGIVLAIGDQVYVGAEAALKAMKYMRKPYPALFYASRIIPGFLRRGIYRFIARNRYKWFGKADACMLPKKGWQARFIDLGVPIPAYSFSS